MKARLRAYVHACCKQNVLVFCLLLETSLAQGSDALPPPATEGEIAEAREIFKKAQVRDKCCTRLSSPSVAHAWQDDLKERNRMKAKVMFAVDPVARVG